MISRLVIASRNSDKVSEIEAVLLDLGLVGEVASGLELPEVEETGSSLEDNALLKARSAAEATGLPSLGDDTGLEVTALGGGPGVLSMRYAGPSASYDDNVDKLLAEMEGVADRSARFRTVMALFMPNGEWVTAEGVLPGVITYERRGTGGFGYDPVFEVDGLTLAEMGTDAKNSLSHRARALQALAEKVRG